MQRANQNLEELVERTVERLTQTCGSLLSAEQARLEEYQQKTNAKGQSESGRARGKNRGAADANLRQPAVGRAGAAGRIPAKNECKGPIRIWKSSWKEPWSG